MDIYEQLKTYLGDDIIIENNIREKQARFRKEYLARYEKFLIELEQLSKQITEEVTTSCKLLLNNLKELYQAEAEFITAKGDKEKTSKELLEKYPPKRKEGALELKDKLVPPYYLLGTLMWIENAKTNKDKEFYQKGLKTDIEDIKLLNPDVEIRVVEGTDNQKILAFIGVDFDVCRSFLELRQREREAQAALDKQNSELTDELAKNNTLKFTRKAKKEKELAQSSRSR